MNESNFASHITSDCVWFGDMSSPKILCLVFIIIIGAHSIGACSKSPPSEYRSTYADQKWFINHQVWITSIVLSIGIHCFKCNFNDDNLRNQWDIYSSGGMPNCAFDNLFHFDKSQNLSMVWECKSCVKADVYMKGNIILPTKPLSRAFVSQ